METWLCVRGPQLELWLLVWRKSCASALYIEIETIIVCYYLLFVLSVDVHDMTLF